jgi:hypothetical protein
MMVEAAAISVVLLLWNALWSDAFTPPLRKGPSRLELFASEEDEEFIRKKVASVDASL